MHELGSNPIAVLVTIERREPLGGTVGPERGPAAQFSGWIGLAVALDRLISESAGDQERPEPDSPG
jgi:hypothetical protein